MNKKLNRLKAVVCLSIAGILAVSPVMKEQVQAETIISDKDWRVVFTSDSKMESNFKSADIDESVSGMQPGDSLVIKLALSNEHADKTDWYMTNEVLSSLEDSVKIAKGAAYTYILSYTDAKGRERLLFSSDTVGGDQTNGGEEGLHEATTALKDYFYLDTLSTGEKGYISLTVALDGETQGNNYQDTLADLQMNFAVELEAGGPPTFVSTGDKTNVTLYFLCGGIGLFFLLFAVLLQRKNKKAAQTLCGLLIILAICINGSNYAFAEEAYTYKVRIFAGRQGSFAGNDHVEFVNLTESNLVIFNQKSVSLNDNSKYYIRGIKESGRDNDQLLSASAFRVDHDSDYVVIYGILGDAVAYTVSYVDEAGQSLRPSDTFYGNVGDKPVVAFQYIEGYQPQAYNLTGTLQEDASKNVFTFVYSAATGMTVNGQNAANAGQGNGNQNNENQANGNQDNQVIDVDEEATPQGDMPEEVVNIDDEASPLAPGNWVDTLKGENGILFQGILIVLIIILLCFAVAVRMIYKKRKAKKKVMESRNEK